VTALLNQAGFKVGKDRVQRIRRREGLKVPQKQRPRSRLWLNDGSCVRLRPQHINHVWSYDFMTAMTHDGRSLRLLTLLDEFSSERLAIRVAQRLGRYEVIETLAEVMKRRGVPEHIRSDNGRSSWPRSCGNGSRRSAAQRSTLSREVPGRTVTAKASTAASG
jgi:putative transposase